MSFGSLWYGKNTNFPGFFYKKNVGSGVGITRHRRQVTNAQTDIENRYTLNKVVYDMQGNLDVGHINLTDEQIYGFRPYQVIFDQNNAYLFAAPDFYSVHTPCAHPGCSDSQCGYWLPKVAGTKDTIRIFKYVKPTKQWSLMTSIDLSLLKPPVPPDQCSTYSAASAGDDVMGSTPLSILSSIETYGAGYQGPPAAIDPNTGSMYFAYANETQSANLLDYAGAAVFKFNSAKTSYSLIAGSVTEKGNNDDVGTFARFDKFDDFLSIKNGHLYFSPSRKMNLQTLMVSTDTALSNYFPQGANWSMDNAGNFYGFSITGLVKVSPIGVVTEGIAYSGWTNDPIASVIRSSDDGRNHYVMQLSRYDELGNLIPAGRRHLNLKRIIYVPAS